MGEPSSFEFLVQAQLPLLSHAVEDSEVVRAAVASGHASWEQVHELMISAAW